MGARRYSPAFETRMSTRPHCAMTSRTRDSTWSRWVTSVGITSTGLPRRFNSSAREERELRVTRRQSYASALLRKRQGGGAPNAQRGACDDSNFLLEEITGHWCV